MQRSEPPEILGERYTDCFDLKEPAFLLVSVPITFLPSPMCYFLVVFKGEKEENSFRKETGVPSWVKHQPWLGLLEDKYLECGRRSRRAAGLQVSTVRLRTSARKAPGRAELLKPKCFKSRYRQRCMLNVRVLRGHIPEWEPKR